MVEFCAKKFPTMTKKEVEAAAYRIRVMLSQLFQYRATKPKVPKQYESKLQVVLDLIVLKPDPGEAEVEEEEEEEEKDEEEKHDHGSNSGFSPSDLFPPAKRSRVLKPTVSVCSSVEFVETNSATTKVADTKAATTEVVVSDDSPSPADVASDAKTGASLSSGQPLLTAAELAKLASEGDKQPVWFNAYGDLKKGSKKTTKEKVSKKPASAVLRKPAAAILDEAKDVMRCRPWLSSKPRPCPRTRSTTMTVL